MKHFGRIRGSCHYYNGRSSISLWALRVRRDLRRASPYDRQDWKRQGEPKHELQGEVHLSSTLTGPQLISVPPLEIADQFMGFVGQKDFKTYFTLRRTRVKGAV